MSLTFKKGSLFVRRTFGAVLGAAAAGLVAPLLSGLELSLIIPSAALFGATLGGVLQNDRPSGQGQRLIAGLVGGTLAGLCFFTLAFKFGFLGFGAGALFSGAALGALFTSDEDSKIAIGKGVIGGALLATIGLMALMKIIVFGQSINAPLLFLSPLAAGFFALWISAGIGVSHLEEARDPLLDRYAALKNQLSKSLLKNTDQGLLSYTQVLAKLAHDSAIGAANSQEVRGHATSLFEALLHTCESWIQLNEGASNISLADVSARIEDLDTQLVDCDDAMTRSHLNRALSALKAQHSQVFALERTRKRSEAALHAQVALLERLRLCVAQYLASDRERFSVELSEVADQVEHLSEDLDSLSTAIAEADAFCDKRFLADVERAAKRASAREGAEALERIEHEAHVDVKAY